MEFATEIRHATRMLAALEDGILSTEDARPLFAQADPALVYLIISWLRAHYPPTHSAAEGVLGRIVALCAASPAVAQMARNGGQDPIAQWFEESYDYRALDRDAFVALVVEKLES